MPFKKPTKGSVLVFSLIVLSVILSAALSITAVTVSNRKSASSTSQSVQSFQVADSGVEKALKEIYKGSYADLSTMASAFGTACVSGSFSFPVSGGTSTVTFFDTNNTILTCASPTWRNDVAKIKVEGTSAGTTRVIETAVAAAGCFGSYQAKSANTDYTAATSGMVVYYVGGNGASDDEIYVCVSSSAIASCNNSSGSLVTRSTGFAGASAPVRSGDHWFIGHNNQGNGGSAVVNWVSC